VEERTAAGETGPQGRVLIVDDNPDTREALGDLLGALGYCVADAADGMEALEYLHSHDRPDLILCDLVMPRMNGWVFRIEQQRDPALAGIPVVFLSGVHDARSAAEYLRAANHLEKPIDPELLCAILRQYAQ